MRDTRTGWETVVVKSGELVRGPNTELPKIITAIDAGQDDRMFIPAREEVEENVDPDDHPEGRRVATIHYDMDAKDYSIDYHVDIEDEDEECEESGDPER